MMLVTWTCTPLDHALQRVQHLSAQRGSVLHLLNPDLSPIPEARASLKTMLFSDLQAGVLDTVFWYYGYGPDILNEVRLMICQMVALLTYKFLDLETWPLQLLRMADVRHGQNRAWDAADDLYSARRCCLDASFSWKARQLFPDAAAMVADDEFQSMIRYFADVLLLDSMIVERLLALIKKSSPGKSNDDLPLAERLVSQGFLTQRRQAHRQVLGKDAAFVTRKRLLEADAPLKCAPRVKSSSSRTSGFLEYRRHALTGRGRMQRPDANAWETQLARDWALLSEIEKHVWEDKAKVAQNEDSDPLPDPKEILDVQTKAILLGLCDAFFPLGLIPFVRTLRDMLNVQGDRPPPGIVKCQEHLRKPFLDKHFIDDDQCIPKSRKFRARQPCGLCHPGVCRERDVAFYHQLMDAARAVTRICCLERAPIGGFYEVKCKDDDGAIVGSSIFFLAHVRKANPEALLCLLCCDTQFPRVRFLSDDRFLVFGFLSRILRGCFVSAHGAGKQINMISIVGLAHINVRSNVAEALISGTTEFEFAWRPGDPAHAPRRGRPHDPLQVPNEGLAAAFAQISSAMPAKKKHMRSRGGTGPTATGGSRPTDDDSSGEEVLSEDLTEEGDCFSDLDGDDDGDGDGPADGGEKAGDDTRAPPLPPPMHPPPPAPAPPEPAPMQPVVREPVLAPPDPALLVPEPPAAPPAEKGKGRGHGQGRGDRYRRWVVGCGTICINMSNSSLDAECNVCKASKDRKWHQREGARAPQTLAQGRPLGSLMAWLHLPGGCTGSAQDHNSMWELLSYEDRLAWRQHYESEPEFTPLFERERPPRPAERPGGEPEVVP